MSLACLGVATQPFAQPVGIPSMGPASGSELSPALERTLGDAIMEQGRRDPTYVADPDINQYLTEMGRKLASASPDRSTQQITVFPVKDPQINAFALPGGYIGINSGLVVASEDESELASVIAHEFGHVQQRHIARGMTQQSRSGHVMLAALAGALLAALSGSGDLAMGVAAFGQAAAVDQQLGFSRQAEQEADRTGLEMLRRAGFDPRGMTRMFERLGNASRLNEGRGGSAYTSTHPLSIQRLSDIQSRLAETPAATRQDSDTFWYVRAKLRVLQARDSQSLRAANDALTQDTQRATGARQSAAWYGLAYAAWTKRDYATARSALDKAGSNGRNSPEMASLAIALAQATGNQQQALSLADQGWKLWPSSQGIAMARAEALQKAGRDQQAEQFLAQLLRQWPDLPRLHQLRAQSLERLGKPVEARQSMASYYEQIGALPTAVEQLRQARGMTRDFYVQSELDVRIRNLRDKLESDRALLERFKS
jgi:predicted Zn-dependent protease